MKASQRRFPIAGNPNCRFTAPIPKGTGAAGAIALADEAVFAFAKRAKNMGHCFRIRVIGNPGKPSTLEVTFYAQSRAIAKRIANDDPRFVLLAPQAEY